MGAEAEDDLTPEKLLSNTEWIRRIGRRLVVEEGQLDDMVQHTLIAANLTRLGTRNRFLTDDSGGTKPRGSPQPDL